MDSIHGKANKLRQSMLQIHKKIRNLVDECHRRLARWLCENHHVVLLPEFKTKDMVKKHCLEKSTLKLHGQTTVFTNICSTNPASTLGSRSSSALKNTLAKYVDVVESSSQIWVVQRS